MKLWCCMKDWDKEERQNLMNSGTGRKNETITSWLNPFRMISVHLSNLTLHQVHWKGKQTPETFKWQIHSLIFNIIHKCTRTHKCTSNLYIQNRTCIWLIRTNNLQRSQKKKITFWLHSSTFWHKLISRNIECFCKRASQSYWLCKSKSSSNLHPWTPTTRLICTKYGGMPFYKSNI